jgi:hypothetical protein
MALIEKFVVVADHYPVAAGEELIEGMWGMFNSSGEIVKATGGGSTTTIGVLGDTKSTSTSGLPSTNNALLGADATSQAFVNRVSDMYDESKASGRMTVYHSGGTFATNQYESTITSSSLPGIALYVSGNGKLTSSASANSQIVATLVKAPGAYESGVPGTDVNGSLSLGTYLEFKMAI